MLSDRLSNVQRALQANGFTLANYILEVLTNPEYAKEQRESVIQNARPICAALCSIKATSVFPWVWQVAEDKLAEEVLELSQVANGLHLNASQCTSQFLEGSFMKETAQKIYTKGPYIHRLIHRLLDANPSRRRVATLPDSEVMPHEILEEFEGDLQVGDLEETSPIQHEDLNCQSRKEKRTCAHNTALMDIVKSFYFNHVVVYDVFVYRRQLLSSAYCCKAPTNLVTTFRPFSAYFFTLPIHQRKLLKPLRTLVYP